MSRDITVNTFVGMAFNGLKAMAQRGVTVTATVAVALVWNDDIGPTVGQKPEGRNALLGRLQRRLEDAGLKTSSVETWRKLGRKFAENYDVEIANIINEVRNQEGRNSEATPTEYVTTVTQWINAKFPKLMELENDLKGVSKEEKSDADKAMASAHKFLSTIEAKASYSAKDNSAMKAADALLWAAAQIASHARVKIDKDASIEARSNAAAEIKAILDGYKPASVVQAEQDANEEMDTAPDMENVVPMMAQAA